MSIKLNTEYPSQANAPTSEYPSGSFKNKSAPGVDDGTPLEQTWANDMLGARDAILKAAGEVANGRPDTADDSQVLDAMRSLFASGADVEGLKKNALVQPAGEAQVSPIPTVAARAGSVLGFDTDGQPIAVPDVATLTVAAAEAKNAALSTAADRVAVSADAAQVAVDAAQVAADRPVAEAARDEAVEAAREAIAAASSTGPVYAFPETYAAAVAALPGYPEGAIIQVLRDENYNGDRVQYKVESGALVFMVNLDYAANNVVARLDSYADGNGAEMVALDSVFSIHDRLMKVRYPQQFGAKPGQDNTDAFNLMYAASESEGFVCTSIRGIEFPVDGEVIVGGAVVEGGRTDFYLADNAARIRIAAKSSIRSVKVRTRANFSGSAVYLNGRDDWGTRFVDSSMQDFYIENQSSTGNAVHLDCSEPNSRIAYFRSSGVRIMGFNRGLFLDASAPSGFSFINANSFIDYMGGGYCKNFIYMLADKTINQNNDVDSNKLISFDFQEKGNDIALTMIGCKLNQLFGMTFFDLVQAGSVYVSSDSRNNTIQGAWLQPFEDISPDNVVINANNSSTYKSYIEGRAIHAQTFGYRKLNELPENAVDVTVNEGGFWKTKNTAPTTYARFRGLRDGEFLDILCDDDFSRILTNEYIYVPGYGANIYTMTKGVVYRLQRIGAMVVMAPPVTPRVYNASQSIATGTQVFGWSNQEPIGRNDSWLLFIGNDGRRFRVPAWVSG